MCEICEGKKMYGFGQFGGIGSAKVAKQGKRYVLQVNAGRHEFYNRIFDVAINYCPECGEKLNKEEEE